MTDAIGLTKRGCHIDVDIQEEDLAKWISFYLKNDGDLTKLTVSSDASKKGPGTFFEQIRDCARRNLLPLASLLTLVTRNTSEVLKLGKKGRFEVGAHGDILVLEKDEFELVHLLAQGKRMINDGALVVREQFLEDSNRQIELRGQS
jgi:beta-aspartyl-dipeptidase (metallo-type)